MNLATFAIPDLDDVSEFLGKLGGAPGYLLVFLFCIAGIKALRSFKRFPNDGIWLAAILLGAVCNSLIADPMADSFSLRVWLVKNSIFGGIVGFLAVLGYNIVAKRFSKAFATAEGDTDMIGRPPADK